MEIKYKIRLYANGEGEIFFKGRAKTQEATKNLTGVKKLIFNQLIKKIKTEHKADLSKGTFHFNNELKNSLILLVQREDLDKKGILITTWYFTRIDSSITRDEIRFDATADVTWEAKKN